MARVAMNLRRAMNNRDTVNDYFHCYISFPIAMKGGCNEQLLDNSSFQLVAQGEKYVFPDYLLSHNERIYIN